MKSEQVGVKPVESIYYKCIYIFGKTAIFIIENILTLFIKKGIFFPEEDFEWTKKISGKHDVIREEFEKILNENRSLLDVTDLSEEQYKVVKQDLWYFIPLFFYGYKIENYCSKAPNTTALLESIPYMTTAIFSTLKPGTEIAPHRGSYRGFLRYHLGLDIPENYEECKIYFKKGYISYAWRIGEGIVFDDTYQHFVKNNTEEYRTVLYVDFIRPMPKFMLKISFVLFHAIQDSPYVQNVLHKLKKFDSSHKFHKLKYRF